MASHIAGPLYHEVAGMGEVPLLLVHPMPADHTYWLYQQAHFSTWFRMAAVDLPGLGGSPPASQGLEVEDLADACWSVVDEALGELDAAPVLAGISVGSTTVLRMAARQPERVGAVIVSGTGFVREKRFAHERIDGYSRLGVAYRRQHAEELFAPAQRQAPLPNYFLDLITERDAQSDVRSILNIFHALTVPDSEELIQLVSAPTLIITGDQDAAHQGALLLHELLPHSELAIMKGAGHYCSFERPWEWDGLVIDFLRRHNLLPSAG